MGRWRLKRCPRCGGNMFIDRDMDGWYEQCIQCSRRKELSSMAEFRENAAQTRKHPAYLVSEAWLVTQEKS